MKKHNIKQSLTRAIMILIIVLLIPILIINMTLIIKGNVNRNQPPDFLGVAPLAVTTGSMEGNLNDSFKKGALIFVRLLKENEKNSLEVGDVVTFKIDESYVTHRIIEVITDENNLVTSYVTQGDANDSNDGEIPVGSIVGKCFYHIEGIGDFAIFMQTPGGILIFIGLPILLFVLYDVYRNNVNSKKLKSQKEIEEKNKLIEELKAKINANNEDNL